MTITTVLTWLADIVQNKPRILAIILLAGGLIICTRVITYQQSRIIEIEASNLILQDRCTRRVDSIILTFSLREDRLNAETKATLNIMIEDYKTQLKEQRSLDQRVNSSILENEKTLRNNVQKLKQLNDVY